MKNNTQKLKTVGTKHLFVIPCSFWMLSVWHVRIYHWIYFNHNKRFLIRCHRSMDLRVQFPEDGCAWKYAVVQVSQLAALEQVWQPTLHSVSSACSIKKLSECLKIQRYWIFVGMDGLHNAVIITVIVRVQLLMQYLLLYKMRIC